MYDVIVVGAGAGGGAAAWRLCENGLRVLLLDAGPWFDPARDYRLDREDWEHHGFPEKSGSRGRHSYAPMQRLEARWDDLRSWNHRFGRSNAGPRRESEGGYSHVRGIGGSTLHYVGEAHRLHPDAMQMKTRFGAGADWPLTYADLEPYYVVAERTIGVAGPADTGARWRSAPYPLPAHRLCKASRTLGEGARRLGLTWEQNPRAALSQPYDGRPDCNYCGNCSRGCPRRDKGSVDQTFIPKALATGRCEIVPRAAVTELLHGSTRVVQGVAYIDEAGRRRTARAAQVVLACGAVETPRLLLANRSKLAPKGIGNDHGQVGRNFLETLAWVSVALHPEPQQSYAGLPSDGICWDYNRPDAIPGVVGGARFYSATLDDGLVGPIAYAVRLLPGWGRAHKREMRARMGHGLAVGAIGESLPHRKSYVDLDPARRDEHGLPLARIHSYLDETALRRLQFMANTCRRMLSEAGCGDLLEETGSYDHFGSSHVFGTCRMGAAPRGSVVDAACIVHRWANLAICDASAFASSGGGESPSLTIQALAIRAADGISRSTPMGENKK